MGISTFKKLPFARGLVLAGACLAVLSSCKELKAEKPNLPSRPVSASRSTVSGTGGEVGVATSVSIRMLDARGQPVQKLTPAVAVVDGTGTVVSGTSASACSESNIYGNSTCTVTATAPGTHYIKVTSPVTFTSSSTVTFVQITRSLSFSTQPTATVTAGVVIPQQPIVQLLDRVGNLNTTTGTETVTLALTTPGTANLTGTTSVAAVAGVADFVGMGLTVDIAATYTFTATAPSITSGVSSSFTIEPAAGSQVGFTTQPSASTAANIAFAQQPVVAIQDAFGNTVSSSCAVTLSLTSGVGTLLGTMTKTAVLGVADFRDLDLRINTSVGGSGYVLTATPQGACAAYAVDTSSTFTITLAGVPYELVLATSPSTSSLNDVWATQPVIQVLDIDGNLASSDNSTVVTLTKGAGSPAGGILNGATSITVENGEATFAGLSIMSNAPADAGTYNLDFDATNPDVGAGFTNIVHPLTINSNGMVGARLVFGTQPSNVSIGQSVPSFTVRIVDASGYLCDACTDDVTINYYYGSAPAGVMSGTVTRAAVSGVATFPGLSFSTAGIKQLSATAGGLTTAYSSSFSVSSYGTASKLAFGTQPASGGSTGQTAWVTQPTVQIQDSASNVVVSDSSTMVTLACVFPATGCTLIGTTTVQAVNGVATFTDLRTAETGLTGVTLGATSSSDCTGSAACTPTQSNSFTGNAP